MTIVREIADALDVLGKVVDNTRGIVKAVSDGKVYLRRRFPDADKEFAELLRQMQLTVEGLAAVTGVMSDFRFVVGSEYATERDLVRFNNYLIKQNKKVEKLKGRIRKLKADCDKIRKLRDALNARGTDHSWSSMFGLLGMRSSRRRDALADTIGDFYADDLRMIDVIEQMLRLSQEALADVDRALGEPGLARPFNVPTAAQMLGVYATMFKEPKQQLNDLIQSLHEVAVELEPA